MDSNQKQILRERYNLDGSALRRDQLELLKMLQKVDETIKKFIHCQEYINGIYGADR